ncbi:hypothetical protein SAMN02745129_1128 [Ferrimonas marina]|uniref:Uncharacterized protein n=1 Tax=Ferrimonas marina TaxID=299255 RepID=A0A1M5NP28_9GAMM|nr:hypothetical protein SAMN02745129_1128 [Ferrimonas marina]
MSALHRLIGMRLIKFDTHDGRTSLHLDGAVITSFNRTTFYPGSQPTAGCRVEDVEYLDGVALKLVLCNNHEICISLYESDYEGPEAFNVRFSDGQIVVEQAS